MYFTHACYELYQTSQVPILIHWTELFVCWVWVAPQDIKHIESVATWGNALHVGSKSCLYEFTELNFLSVGSKLPPRTLNILIDWLIDWYSWIQNGHHQHVDCAVKSKPVKLWGNYNTFLQSRTCWRRPSAHHVIVNRAFKSSSDGRGRCVPFWLHTWLLKRLQSLLFTVPQLLWRCQLVLLVRSGHRWFWCALVLAGPLHQ